MSDLVEIFRHDFPDSAGLSDDDILLKLGQERPDLVEGWGAKADYDMALARASGRAAAQAAGVEKPSVSDYFKQPVSAAIRAATETIAGVPEAIAIASSGINRAVKSATGIDLGDADDPSQQFTGKLAQRIRSVGEAISPEPVEALKDSFWATKIPSTVGSIGAFVAGGGLGKALVQGSVRAAISAAAKDAFAEAVASGANGTVAKGAAQFAADQVTRHAAVQAAELIPAGLMGAGTQAASAYQDAVAAGANPDQAFRAYMFNLPVGASMALPVGSLLGEGKTLAGKVARDAAVGAGVMAGQTAASNLIAEGIYDPGRDIMAGVGESAGAGGIVTAALSALAHKVLRSKPAAQAQAETEPNTTGTQPMAPEATQPQSINPAENYLLDDPSKALVTEVLRRELSGETSPSLQAALAGVYAEPQLHAFYTLEKNRLANEAANAGESRSEITTYPDEAPQAPTGPTASPEDETGSTLAQVPQASSETGDGSSVQLTVAPEMERALGEPDYSKEQQNKLTPQESQDIVAEGASVPQTTPNLPARDPRIDAARAAAARFSDRGSAVEDLPWPKLRVKIALIKGQAIPERVLAANRDLVRQVQEELAAARSRAAQTQPERMVVPPPAPSVPEGWRMTPADFAAGTKGAERKAILDAHRNIVEQALYRRLPVPDSVLASYPELSGLRAEIRGSDSAYAQTEQAGRRALLQQEQTRAEALREKHLAKNPWMRLAGQPEQLLQRIDFNAARPVSLEAGPGRKSAATYTETTSADELYKDSRASASEPNLTRKLGVFLSDDGSHAMVSTVYFNKGKRYVTAFNGDGDTRGVQFSNLKGYKLVAALKTVEPVRDQVVTYSSKTWNDIATTLRTEGLAVKATAAAVEHQLGMAGFKVGDRAHEPAITREEPVEFDRDHGEAIHSAIAGLPLDRFEAGFEDAVRQSKRAVKGVEAALKVLAGETGKSPEILYRALKGLIYDHEAAHREGRTGFAESIYQEINSARARDAGQGGLGSPFGEESPKAIRSQRGTEPDSSNPGRAGARTIATGGREGVGSGTEPSPAAQRAASAAATVDTNPSEAQKAAGNYAKGHVTLDGLDISIENPKGSIRSKQDAGGKALWAAEMPAHYGQILGVEGAEKGENGKRDLMDVYIGDHPESDRVFVVDQVDPKTGLFEEHKAMMGFDTPEQATSTYDAAFNDGSGPSRRGALTEMTKEEFKDWIEQGDTREALAYGKRREESFLARLSARGESVPGVEHLASAGDLRAMWDGAIDSARANGMDVTPLQGLHERGVSSPRAIVLTVADPLRPSHDNVILLFHELGHEVFRLLRLPPAMEEAFHRAIARLAVPEGGREAVRADILKSPHRSEEILMERSARNLIAEGFAPQAAQSIAQRLLRMVQRLYYRSLMALQRGLLGPDHVSPELAQRYFETRLRSFLAGDSSPMSFLSFVGGPKLTVGQRGDTFRPLGGAGAVSGAFNYDRGTGDIHEVLADTNAGLAFNHAVADAEFRYSRRGESQEPSLAFTRVSDPHVISADYNSPAKVEVDIAAYNALHDAHQAVWRAFQAAHLARPGYTFEAFLRDFTNADGPATDKSRARNDELVKTAKVAGLDWKPVDPTVRPDDLVSEANKLQAADTAYRYLWSLREHWTDRRRADETFMRTAGERLTGSNARLQELTKEYTDTSLTLGNAKEALREIHGDFLSDLRAAVGAAHRTGVLTQVIEQMDGHSPDPKYARVIDALYKRLTGDSDSFIHILHLVSELGLDWQKTDTKTAVGVISKLIAPGDPQLHRLENRALAAITVAFAKRNYHVLGLIEVAKSTAFKDRADLNKILRDAMSNTQDAIPRARELARKLPNLAVVADRLLSKLEELRAENRTHLDAMQRAKAFIDLHTTAARVLNDHMVHLERMLGARFPSWEPINGAEYFVAPRIGARDDQVMENKHLLKLAGAEGNSTLVQHIHQNNAWLDSVPADKRGAVWNTVKEMTTKLEHTVGIAQHELVIKNSVLNYYLGSIIDKFESTGLPALRQAAQRFRRYRAEQYASASEAEAKGTAWDGTKARAMKALGYDRVGEATFERLFYQAAHSFAEKNPHIFAAHKDVKSAFDAFLPQLRRFLETDKDTWQRMQRPGAWKALQEFYRTDFAASDAFNQFRRKLGMKVQETLPGGATFEREPIGVTFGTAMRRAARPTIRLYQNMRDLGWLGTKDGESFDYRRIEAEYFKDRDGLDRRLKAFVPGGVWRDFVGPLATGMEGRAAFYGPRLVDGLTPVAIRENVAKAYESSGGSLVQFAESLFGLESISRSVAESQPEFVAKTIKGLHDYFMSMHGQFAEMDDASRHGLPTPPRAFQDARVTESWPGAWLEYATHGRYETHQLYSHLAAQAAFGRNLEGMRIDLRAGMIELSAKADRFRSIRQRVVDEHPGAKGKRLDTLIRQAVEKAGDNYTSLSQAQRNLEMVRNESRKFEHLMNSFGGLAMEMLPFQELVSAFAGATVQGPLTALVHLPNVAQSFAKLGLGPAAMKVIRQSASSMSSEALGSLTQFLHGQIAWNADRNARRIRNGIVEPDAFRRFGDAWTALLGDPARANNPVSRGAFKLARGMRLMTSAGFGKAQEGAKNAYATLKPHAIFTQLAQTIDAGLIDGWTHGFEDMIERAVSYFKEPAHAGDLTDPAFRFTKLTDLGYSKGLLGIGSDERASKYFYNALARYGIDLETQARSVLERRAHGDNAPAINDEQFRALACLVQNEVTLESSIATRPSSFFTDPVFRLGSPLIGWSVAKSHDAWENYRNPDMTQTSQSRLKAFGVGMLPYLALVPIGVALGALRDNISQKLLGKKPNREDPLTSFAGMVDALAWTGTFGLAGDVLASQLNKESQRPFTIDHRVFFISTLLNAKDAVENWLDQGSADYATVYRPLFQALGGSGFLQSAQLFNHLLSLDNAEARVVARVNATNLLRAAGREIKLDVRHPSGEPSSPTPTKPFLGQMLLAAYANDPAQFREAYQNAIQAAKQEGKPDPAKHIAQAFEAYNPLRTVFRTEPTKLQVGQMLQAMDPESQNAVRTAIARFNGFAVQIGAKPFDGKAVSIPMVRTSLAPLDMAEIRHRAAALN
jgi:hypothetical protein